MYRLLSMWQLALALLLVGHCVPLVRADPGAGAAHGDADMSKVDNEAEYKKMLESTIGKVLLVAPGARIAVGAKMTGGQINSVSINDTQHVYVSVEMIWRQDGKRPEVVYSTASSDNPRQYATWYDVNSDGVFDFRLLVGAWPQFNNETGARAYIDGKWMPAGRDACKKDQLDHPTVVTDDGKQYEFDFTSGKWVSAVKAAVVPATQHAR